jgi:uroporphyrinogen-III synthase
MATVVLTRDPADTPAYARVLAPLGLEVVAMPVTRTVSAADPDALVRALADGTYIAIVIASPRAAHELARAYARIAHTIDALPTIWAVGPATKRALEIAKLPAHLPDDVRDGGELAVRLATSRDLRGERVLVPRAEDGRTETLDTLREAGAIVVDVVAYRTLPATLDDQGLRAGSDALSGGTASVCGVFAPSQVSALAQVMAARGHTLASLSVRFCAIGDTTAAALHAAGVTEVAVAPAPTPEGMAHAVGSVYPPRT